MLPSNNANIWPLKGGGWIEGAQTSAVFEGDYFILGSAVGVCLPGAHAQIEATGYDDLNRSKCDSRVAGSRYWPKRQLSIRIWAVNRECRVRPIPSPRQPAIHATIGQEQAALPLNRRTTRTNNALVMAP